MIKFNIKPKLPLIFTVLSVFGLTATAILSAKCGTKIEEKLEDITEDTPTVEIVKKVAPTVAPAAIAYVATAGCIIGGFITGNRLYKGALASCAAATELYRRYRDKTVELYGEEADHKIVEGVVTDKIQEEAKKIPDEEFSKIFLCYEPNTKKYFTATREIIFDMERAVNCALMTDGAASVVTVLDASGDAIISGDDCRYGWNFEDIYSGYYLETWIYIGTIPRYSEEKGEYLELSYSIGPWEDWYDEYNRGMSFQYWYKETMEKYCKKGE